MPAAAAAEDLLYQAVELFRMEREQLELERAEVAAGAEILSESYLAQLAEGVGIDIGIQRERLRCLELVERQIQALKPTGTGAIILRRLLHQISSGETLTTITGDHHG
jgi:hypothetical protein